MQFMVSNLTGLPPIWVQGSYSDSGVLDFKGGISTGANHYDVSDTPEDLPRACVGQRSDLLSLLGLRTVFFSAQKRSECVTKFVDMFGGMPLVETSIVAVPMSSWTPMKTPPAIWEWIHKI